MWLVVDSPSVFIIARKKKSATLRSMIKRRSTYLKTLRGGLRFNLTILKFNFFCIIICTILNKGIPYDHIKFNFCCRVLVNT